MAEEQATQAKPGIDVKVWIAAVLFVVGFLIGGFLAESRVSGEVKKAKETADGATAKIEEFSRAMTSARGFIMKVRDDDNAAYAKALGTLSPQDQQNVEKIK